jgi:hypothetical protein
MAAWTRQRGAPPGTSRRRPGLRGRARRLLGATRGSLPVGVQNPGLQRVASPLHWLQVPAGSWRAVSGLVYCEMQLRSGALNALLPPPVRGTSEDTGCHPCISCVGQGGRCAMCAMSRMRCDQSRTDAAMPCAGRIRCSIHGTAAELLLKPQHMAEETRHSHQIPREMVVCVSAGGDVPAIGMCSMPAVRTSPHHGPASSGG